MIVYHGSTKEIIAPIFCIAVPILILVLDFILQRIGEWQKPGLQIKLIQYATHTI